MHYYPDLKVASIGSLEIASFGSLKNCQLWPITEGQTNFLGTLTDVSLSATKKAVGKHVISHLTDLLTATDSLSIRGEYKLWIYRNYIL